MKSRGFVRTVTTFVSVICLSCFSSTGNCATTASPLVGVSLHSSATGYVELKGPIELNPGDSVIVNPGGMAQINYDDGCAVKVNPGDVAMITETSPCKAGGIQTGSVADPAPEAGGFSGAAPYIIGVAAVAGGVALAAAAGGGGGGSSGGNGGGGGGNGPASQ